MIVQTQPPIHLTYCLNVHPGETWAENFAAIRSKALEVRRKVAPDRRFGLGLRLSRHAAGELSAPAALAGFREFLDDENLYVFTINGFPYGQFHGRGVKQDVYRPDWSTNDRLNYTNLLADVLAFLLPEGIEGSISTLPLGYRTSEGRRNIAQMTRMIAESAMFLDSVSRRSGKIVRLAIEPEPDCLIERTDELIEFFNGPLMSQGAENVARERRLDLEAVQEILRRHVGACLDTAHAAVEFESPASALEALRQASMPVAKVQLSSALALEATPEALSRAREFVDETYLHQTRVRLASGKVLRFPDLGEALESNDARQSGSQWRVHFHVPLFFTEHEHLRSTSSELTGLFASLLPLVCGQAEIETYTMNVLPEFLRPADVSEAIACEFEWVRANVLRE